MGNVYSIRTKKKLDQQDTQANDKTVSNQGKYIGCLPKPDAEELRKFQDKLICQQAQINELIEEFDEAWQGYLRDVASLFLYLGIDPQSFSPERDLLFIGEDGHMWVLPNEEGGNNDETK